MWITCLPLARLWITKSKKAPCACKTCSPAIFHTVDRLWISTVIYILPCLYYDMFFLLSKTGHYRDQEPAVENVCSCLRIYVVCTRSGIYLTPSGFATFYAVRYRTVGFRPKRRRNIQVVCCRNNRVQNATVGCEVVFLSLVVEKITGCLRHNILRL